MKIGIIPPATRTGEYKYSQYLIEGLKKKGISIEILSNFILNRPRTKVFLGSILLSKLIREKYLSIVHNLDNLPPYLFKSHDTEAKFILTVHDIAPVILPHIGNPIMKFDFAVMLPKLISNSDHVIVPSYSTKNDLLSKFNVNKKKISVIPMGIDLSIFYPRTQEEWTKKYGIWGRYILYVGNDNPRKNLKNLILSFCKISNDIPHNLVLVGPINKKKVKKMISNYTHPQNRNKLLNRIIMPAYVSDKDLPLIYSGAEIFVFPSLYEGFGFPPLEAMACGTPLIASYNSSLKETLGKAVVYIYNPLDPEEISGKVLRVLEDKKLREEIKEKGLEQVKKFSWEKTVENTFNIYNKIT